MTDQSKKVGFLGLIAIVVGSMIGGGVFNLPSNMADGAALGAVLIAWVITAIGMFFLVQTFKTLSDNHPDLSSGILVMQPKVLENMLDLIRHGVIG